MTICLTPAELLEVTGYKSARGQRGWLKAHGWVFTERRDGSPVVSRAYFLARTGTPGMSAPGLHPAGPNWAAIG